MLAPGAILTNLGDRARFAPYGLRDGRPGIKGTTVLNPGTPDERVLSSKGTYRLSEGDVISWRTSGAGGLGHPRARVADRVLSDVLNGIVGIEGARRDYGVVIDRAAMTVDIAATEKARAGLT